MNKQRQSAPCPVGHQGSKRVKHDWVFNHRWKNRVCIDCGMTEAQVRNTVWILGQQSPQKVQLAKDAGYLSPRRRDGCYACLYFYLYENHSAHTGRCMRHGRIAVQKYGICPSFTKLEKKR